MEEQLVSFETAKLAKEKGFNVGVDKVYREALFEGTNKGWEGVFPIGSVFKDEHYHINNHVTDMSNEYWYHCAAPTQSLLLRWLREEHKMHISITTWEHQNWYPIFFKNGREIKFEGKFFEFDTYEEALEAGLKEMLNLVE